MPRLRTKSFADPDELRTLSRGHAAVVTLDETTVGRASYEPGWRWSTDLAPATGTKWCPLRHLGYAISGTLQVRLPDGEGLRIGPDSVYEIPAGHDAWVVGDEPFVTVEWTSAGSVGVVLEGPTRRILITILFTDIVDSTATIERLGDDAWRSLLRRHDARLREQLNLFHGREVKTTGDGFLAIFDGATRAVLCGVASADAAAAMGLPIRVGIHTGEVELVGEDVRGLAIHAAARVMALAGPGEVMVSSATSALLEGSGVVLEDVGSHELKGLSGGRQVFKVRRPDGVRPG